MQGLLDIWGDYWKRKEPQNEDGTYGSSTDFSNRTSLRRGQTVRSNLSTAGGVEPTGNLVPRVHRKRGESPSLNNISSVPSQNRMTGKGPQVNENISRAERARNLALTNPDVKSVSKSGQVTYKQDASKTPMLNERSDALDLKHHGGDQQDQLKWWQQLAGKMGVDFDKAAASWKDKGGFEGLMANPAFTMGLAFMQAGAEGKSLGQGALDNVMKAGGISQHYKKIIEGRSGDVVEATEGQMDKIKDILSTKGISAPILRKMLPGNQAESYEQAVEDIVMKVQKKVKAKKKAAKASGKDIEVGSRLYKKIIDEMIASGEIDKKGGLNIGGYQVIDATLESKAEGGPIQAGKPYLVGEEGPEVVIPHSDGNVLSNDDSQIYAMLLAANPQLQKVSKIRAEKILRNRFPEYFE